MFNRRKNEFLRSRPVQRNRNVLFDLSNFIIPVFFIVLGFILFSQVFASLVGFNPEYTDAPVLVTKEKHLFIPKGYPFYNPGLIFLIAASRPFDPVINAVILKAFFPLFVCAGLAVVSFFIVSFIRGSGLNRAENLYGSARWGNERDLKRFALTRKQGIVLAQFQKANLSYKVNPENGSVSLIQKKTAPLICHAGGTNTLTIAPTRSGKGVGSIIPTCLNYPGSMIIFDPKGELFQFTSGFRRRFSRVIKFSPISHDTCRFNPLEEVELTEQAFADIGLVLANMFEPPERGNDGASSFFDNNAQDLLTGLIFHVLSSRLYPDEKKNLNGVLSILSQAASQETQNENGEQTGLGDELLNQMKDSEHFDKDGNKSDYIHRIISNAASRCLGQHFKVRSDVFSTVFSKMRLFEDPYISYVTGASDFSLKDFYDSTEPISLYLTVPFSDIKRIAPVFKLLINFILNKFSRGEASYGSVSLKNKIVFLLDEFPVLGAFPFLSDTLGILAGYGITFYIVVQALAQIKKIYGQDHTFLDNCKTVMVYAPGKIEDAKTFTDMIGKESVLKESVSASGSRYSVSLNNINASSQEVARDLMNPDELMKLPPTEALILNQGMPAYIGKKCVYYTDRRFKYKAFSKKTQERSYLFPLKLPRAVSAVLSRSQILILSGCIHAEQKTASRTDEGRAYSLSGAVWIFGIPLPVFLTAVLARTPVKRVMITETSVLQTGYPPPAARNELEQEIEGLPSVKRKRSAAARAREKRGSEDKKLNACAKEDAGEFDVFAYMEPYPAREDFVSEICSYGETAPEEAAGGEASGDEEDGNPADIPGALALDPSYFMDE
jgi:type IV secretion system protein VirD4